MPICVRNNLPVKEILEKENIFVMDEERASHQDIRPIQILICNLMPKKEETELHLLRALSNTPLQIQITFLGIASHEHKNTSRSHLDEFYYSLEEIKDKEYDGLIITGAPVEKLSFEEVDYWDELTKIMEWSKSNVTSTLYICWGAQAGLYYHYGIDKLLLTKKLSGVYKNKVFNRKIPLVRGFDDEFFAPQSRYTESIQSAIYEEDDLQVLAASEEAGIFLAMDKEGHQIYVTGHPEYDRYTLDGEYQRDLGKALEIDMPRGYYPQDDPKEKPLMLWRAHSNMLYSNWLNYYVYQVTPYNLMGAPSFSKNNH